MTKQNNHSPVPLDFDYVSPEIMDNIEVLRESSLMTSAVEDLADATPLCETDKNRSGVYIVNGSVFVFTEPAADAVNSGQA